MNYKALIGAFICVAITVSPFFADTGTDNKDQSIIQQSRAQQAMANPDYRVLPGDVYELGYAIGQTTVKYPIVVDSSGIIRVSNLGVVNTSGKTFITVK